MANLNEEILAWLKKFYEVALISRSELGLPQGAPGPPGPPGPPGRDVGLMYSVMHQMLFNVTHNLGKVPSVEIRDQEGRIVQARVEFPDLNNTTIRFSRFFTGTIHLN